MDAREIIRHIDSGANYYISLFGDAEHMQIIDREFYSILRPRGGEHGIKFIFNIRTDGLPEKQRSAIADEIKSLGMPFWLDLSASDEEFRLFFGRDRVHGLTELAEHDEVYLAMLPEELPDYPASDCEIAMVRSADEFAEWAKLANDVLAGGYPDMHPIYHYPLCANGKMKCYIAYSGGFPAAVAAILDDRGIASLEFVATLPELRRQGYATAVCGRAVSEAFADGAKIVTVRAIDAATGRLYRSMGFKVYNYAI